MPTESESSSPLRRRLSVLMSVGVLAVGGAAAAGCGGDESPDNEASGGGQPAPATQEQPPSSGVTVADILTNPQQYTGQQVTVEGAIAQIVVEPGVFTIGKGGVESPGVKDAAGELVVLPTQGTQISDEDIRANNILRVQGTVQLISDNIAEEDDFLFEEAGDTSFLEQFQDQPAVVATQVQWDKPPALEDQTQENPSGE